MAVLSPTLLGVEDELVDIADVSLDDLMRHFGTPGSAIPVGELVRDNGACNASVASSADLRVAHELISELFDPTIPTFDCSPQMSTLPPPRFDSPEDDSKRPLDVWPGKPTSMHMAKPKMLTKGSAAKPRGIAKAKPPWVLSVGRDARPRESTATGSTAQPPWVLPQRTAAVAHAAASDLELSNCVKDLHTVMQRMEDRLQPKQKAGITGVMACLAMTEESLNSLSPCKRTLVQGIRSGALLKRQQAAAYVNLRRAASQFQFQGHPTTTATGARSHGHTTDGAT